MTNHEMLIRLREIGALLPASKTVIAEATRYGFRAELEENLASAGELLKKLIAELEER